MERVRMFLSPYGTLGMKYLVRRAPPARLARLWGSLMPTEVPKENVEIAAGHPKSAVTPCRTRGGSLAPLLPPLLPARKLAWERWRCSSRVAHPCQPHTAAGSSIPGYLQPCLAFSPSSESKNEDGCLAMDFVAVAMLQGLFFFFSPVRFTFCFCFASVLSKIAAPSTE